MKTVEEIARPKKPKKFLSQKYGLRLSVCPGCGGNKIEIGDCGYSSFNIGWVKCLSCKHEHKPGYVGCFPENELAKSWNDHCLEVYKEELAGVEKQKAKESALQEAINQALKPSQDLLNEAYDALNEALVEEPIKSVTNDYTLRLESVFNKVGEFLGKKLEK